ncbi:MAG: hypothetical protein R6X20_12360 [Phycisphaerae bacterium]
MLLTKNPLIDFDKLLFIRRYTFQSTHFYTDFIDGCERYGGNLCVLDIETGEVTDLVPEMADGRILYTRWEYVDKGQLGVKCLWAMGPDGTGTVEVYGNDIALPPSFMYGRQVPGEPDVFVFTGAPHFPQGGSFGTIIRADTSKDIRTRKPMTCITPNVDVRQEPGWNQKRGGRWVRDEQGPLYTDPYPLSKNVLLVAHNPDRVWHDRRACGLYVLDDLGHHVRIYEDETFSCRQPMPLRPRTTPPVIPSRTDPDLARKGLAVCVVQDVTRGMAGVERGEVRYLRIMEQIPRPWDARRFWDPDDDFDNHTHLISDGTALGGKAMWGVVPVEEDGSAHFTVPADRNIYLQALDANYMELQRERTYVNYRPGERRGCVGCHERPFEAPDMRKARGPTPQALARPPSHPQAQPGDERPEQVLHFPMYVQPVLDEFCVRCHGAEARVENLDLRDIPTQHFSRSYERLLRYLPTPRENADFEGTADMPPKSMGSHRSRLIRQVRRGCPGMDTPLPEWARVRLATWVDAAGVYYGSYWGRRHIRFKAHPYFRIVPTFEQAIGTTCPFPMEQR